MTKQAYDWFSEELRAKGYCYFFEEGGDDCLTLAPTNCPDKWCQGCIDVGIGRLRQRLSALGENPHDVERGVLPAASY